LWRVAVAVTLKGLFIAAWAGAVTATLCTLMSAVAVTVVLALPVALLLLVLGSETWSWSMAAVAETENEWAEGDVQVTDQVAGLAGTGVAVDTARLVFCTVTGLVEDVVQSPGRLRVRVVSTLVGP
jgi:hypothetical protein